MDGLVSYETDGRVGIVALNRPDKRNAINDAMREQLMALLRHADEDAATSVVVLRGEGRSFCAGYDIAGGDPDREAWKHDALKWHARLKLCLAMEMLPWEMRKPVIASVQGHALGGGCELAMLCDLTIAADDASFGEPEVRFSTAGPAMVMPWLIGFKRARELLYLGDTIGAEEAKSLGMVNRVVPREALRAETMRIATRMALISPEALQATKRAINRGAEAAGFHTAIDAGLDALAPLYAARTEFGAAFDAMKKTEGLGAALKWRAAQFGG